MKASLRWAYYWALNGVLFPAQAILDGVATALAFTAYGVQVSAQAVDGAAGAVALKRFDYANRAGR